MGVGSTFFGYMLYLDVFALLTLFPSQVWIYNKSRVIITGCVKPVGPEQHYVYCTLKLSGIPRSVNNTESISRHQSLSSNTHRINIPQTAICVTLAQTTPAPVTHTSVRRCRHLYSLLLLAFHCSVYMKLYHCKTLTGAKTNAKLYLKLK